MRRVVGSARRKTCVLPLFLPFTHSLARSLASQSVSRRNSARPASVFAHCGAILMHFGQIMDRFDSTFPTTFTRFSCVRFLVCGQHE